MFLSCNQDKVTKGWKRITQLDLNAPCLEKSPCGASNCIVSTFDRGSCSEPGEEQTDEGDFQPQPEGREGAATFKRRGPGSDGREEPLTRTGKKRRGQRADELVVQDATHTIRKRRSQANSAAGKDQMEKQTECQQQPQAWLTRIG